MAVTGERGRLGQSEATESGGMGQPSRGIADTGAKKGPLHCVPGRAYRFLREDTRVWRILCPRHAEIHMAKSDSPNATPLKRDLVGFHGAITICTVNTFEAHLACNGSHFTREIAETKPFADAIRMRQKLISEKHKLNGNESSVRIKRRKLICFFSPFR
jgi:hypothetical protein